MREINIEALCNNYQCIKKSCGKKVCAMVKADAYGHGIKKVCETLKKDQVFGLLIKFNCKRAALIFFAFDTDFITMIIQNFFHNCQTHTAACCCML